MRNCASSVSCRAASMRISVCRLRRSPLVAQDPSVTAAAIVNTTRTATERCERLIIYMDPSPGCPGGGVPQGSCRQLPGLIALAPPVRMNSPRRFCAQEASFEPRARGLSSPRETIAKLLSGRPKPVR